MKRKETHPGVKDKNEKYRHNKRKSTTYLLWVHQYRLHHICMNDKDRTAQEVIKHTDGESGDQKGKQRKKKKKNIYLWKFEIKKQLSRLLRGFHPPQDAKAKQLLRSSRPPSQPGNTAEGSGDSFTNKRLQRQWKRMGRERCSISAPTVRIAFMGSKTTN